MFHSTINNVSFPPKHITPIFVPQRIISIRKFDKSTTHNTYVPVEVIDVFLISSRRVCRPSLVDRLHDIQSINQKSPLHQRKIHHVGVDARACDHDILKVKLGELWSQHEDVLSVRRPEREYHARNGPLARRPLDEGRKSLLVLRERHIIRKLRRVGDVCVVAQLDLLDSTRKAYQLLGERPPLLLENEGEN